ncbi:hypothetical protein [Nocardioides ferulae]|uniref:hypothetical protein n=1 Tax=Nocardioides ferulae TaxID=2340821 RepID=UPI000F8949E6|nr:hypothetical protein [Nocardioides ferulae]
MPEVAELGAPSPAALGAGYEVVARFRPFALVAPGFAAVADAPVTGGGLHLAEAGPPAPFAAVEVAVPAGARTAAAGLATADGDHLVVRWEAGSSRVTLELRLAGRTRVLRRRRVSTDGGFTLGFALCENQATALVDRGSGWRPVLTERKRVAAELDLRREDTLAGLRYAWSVDAAAPGSATAGLFGMAGLRDPHLVQHADGTAYQRDGRVFLTWTCAGLGFFQQAHWSVWSLDPADPTDLRLESQLFTRRDGLVLGDHAGQLVRVGDRWLVATSSWGDFAPGRIHVRHTETDADLLSGVHLLETERTPLPTAHGSWDPALTRVDGRWQVAYVESPSQDPFDFHPALASTDRDRWTDGLTPVFAAADLRQCEGPVLVTAGGTTWLLASDRDAAAFPVFDLAGRRAGRLDAPYPTNIPHPQLLPDPAGGWWLLTFDGTGFAPRVMRYGGHGDVVVMHSA